MRVAVIAAAAFLSGYLAMGLGALIYITILDGRRFGH